MPRPPLLRRYPLACTVGLCESPSSARAAGLRNHDQAAGMIELPMECETWRVARRCAVQTRPPASVQCVIGV
jgi:hypothetical protein